MRFGFYLTCALLASLPTLAVAQSLLGGDDKNAPKQIEVTADQSLEWYQDQHLYVARGGAKAVRGDMTVNADLMTAHERDKPAPGTAVQKPAKSADTKAADASAKDSSAPGGGDLDKLTAEGHVTVTTSKSRIVGDHMVYDLDKQMIVVTGTNLRYETDKETVTARDSLEYYDDKKIAVARGHAIADSKDRHVQADILSAEFRPGPNGTQELSNMVATGHVTVITKNDISRGDHAVYNADNNTAVLNGHAQITRADGTQLSGEVAEADFKNNQSRMLNTGGKTRVRALLPAKSTDSNKGGGDSDDAPVATGIPLGNADPAPVKTPIKARQ